jgi:ankyrin repeat protein
MTDNITADAITSAKRPNPWIEFQARVKDITQLDYARELSSYLRSKKPYAEWSDSEIVRESLQWVRDEPLFDACVNGDLEMVKRLATNGANITVRDKDDCSLIHYAVWGGDHVELVMWLIDSGVPCDMNTLLRGACYGGHVGLGNLAINRGENLDTKMYDGESLMLFACENSHIAFVKFLLNKGVDVNATSVTGATALHMAARHNDADLAKFILSKGVDVNATSVTGATALHIAASHTAVELAKLLLTSGADVCKKDTTIGATPLDKAIKLFNLKKTHNEDMIPAIEMIDLLRSVGAIAAKETMPDELTVNIVSPLTHTATVNKAQADAEKAKTEETRVRAEEAANITEAEAVVVSVEARIVELKRRLAEEETLLIAAKETAKKVRASAEVAVVAAAAATATAIESALSSLSPDSDNSINHVSDREPIYERRKKIPKRIRTIVWNKYVGEDTPRSKCFCCRDTTISFSAFDCGHVIAESKGGDMTISNLRPVCHDCNLAMGTRSMNDFTTEFFGWSV